MWEFQEFSNVDVELVLRGSWFTDRGSQVTEN